MGILEVARAPAKMLPEELHLSTRNGQWAYAGKYELVHGEEANSERRSVGQISVSSYGCDRQMSVARESNEDVPPGRRRKSQTEPRHGISELVPKRFATLPGERQHRMVREPCAIPCEKQSGVVGECRLGRWGSLVGWPPRAHGHCGELHDTFVPFRPLVARETSPHFLCLAPGVRVGPAPFAGLRSIPAFELVRKPSRSLRELPAPIDPAEGARSSVLRRRRCLLPTQASSHSSLSCWRRGYLPVGGGGGALRGTASSISPSRA